MLRTALVTDRRYLNHHPGRVHPERPERVEAMIEMAEGLTRDGLTFLPPREATLDELELCHERDYIASVARTAGLDRYAFDADTTTSPESYRTALLAAGGVLTAAEAVLEGVVDNGFAIVRPPGHHALPARAMGFCLFNNVAIAAAWLIQRRGLKRVAVIDWDVHHGNGTQDMFYYSADVLYASTHQFPHYPGTGSIDEIGEGPGEGFTVNVPMPATFGDPEYLRAFDELIIPICREFKPEFVLVSAGFDCHFRDPLASMRVTENGFLAMTRRIKRLAAECCESRMVAVLEGGYDLKALADSGQAVIEELGREADEPIAPAADGDRVMPIIERAKNARSPIWKMD
ncbi:MAG TPA: histone deacetylase [Candidatus Binataceae bacterium]|nr:histone deacetylase [Candidatus Binataceae bacterium]